MAKDDFAKAALRATLDGDNFRSVAASMQVQMYRMLSRDCDPLLTVNTEGLFEIFLGALPADKRQAYTCNCCKAFVRRFGGIVSVDEVGNHESAIWPWTDGEISPLIEPAIEAVRTEVMRRPVAGPFVTSNPDLGVESSGGFDHFCVHLASAADAASGRGRGKRLHRDALMTAGQRAAELREDCETLHRALESYPPDLLRKAHAMLRDGVLVRAEKAVGKAEWLVRLRDARTAAVSEAHRDALTWRAVVLAPAGWCKVKSGALGSLLDDLQDDRLTAAAVAARWAAKLAGDAYMRPTTVKAGNVAAAEKAFEVLGLGPALRRRFATVADLAHRAAWLPRSRPPSAATTTAAPASAVAANDGPYCSSCSAREDEGHDADCKTPDLTWPQATAGKLFGHLLGSSSSVTPTSSAGAGGAAAWPQTQVTGLHKPPAMTWVKFESTVLPHAVEMQFYVPAERHNYTATVTAADPDAPPILRWDAHPDAVAAARRGEGPAVERNPFSQYVYLPNSDPTMWGLTPGTWCNVVAVVQKPSMWSNDATQSHQGKGVAFMLEGCRDLAAERGQRGGGLFPECLRGDLHAYRSTIEAHVKSTAVEQPPLLADGQRPQHACGVSLAAATGGASANIIVRARRDDGSVTAVTLDRWD